MNRSVFARAPINIALVKYWGKRDTQHVLPYNPSISVSLDLFETQTRLTPREDGQFVFTLNGQADSESRARAIRFMRHFDPEVESLGLTVETHNTGPTAAGLASSASGYAALAVACNAYFDTNYSLETLASITRKGSGSAVRSLLGGCVRWETDGTIRAIDWPFKDFKMAIVVLDDQTKAIGSTEAMQRTIDTSLEYEAWVKRAHIDADALEAAIQNKDFQAVGMIAEANALAMHALCRTAHPPIDYLNARSRQLIQAIQAARQAGLFEVYCTLDAGPNVKLMHRAHDTEPLRQWLIQQGYPRPLFSHIDTQGAVVNHE